MPNTTRNSEPILIAGAGIGGLTVAKALADRGFAVEVLERGTQVRGLSGSGLTIWTNALEALSRIGLDEAVASQGVALERQEMCTRSGEVLNSVPVGSIGRRLGRTGVGIRRQALLSALLAGCAGVPVRYEAKVITFDQDDKGVTVGLEDGTQLRGSALIGADGIRSRVRARLLADGPPEPDGHMIWRGISDSHANFPSATAYMVLGPDGPRSVAWPVSEDAVCWSVSNNGPPATSDDDDPETVKSALLRMLDRFPSPVLSIVQNTPAKRLMRTDLFSRPRADRWAVGRVALLGDAAHAMPTVYGQGACQAIEDAVVLADALASAADLPTGLAEYERRRVPRVAWIRERVFQLSRYQGWTLPLLVTMRNATLRQLPASATESTWTRLLTFDPGTPEASRVH